MTAPSGSPAAQPAGTGDPGPDARSADNCAYVRRLLRDRQPGFAITLELAGSLASQYADLVPGTNGSTHRS